MQKRAIIVHGWDGYPEEGWFPWLKNELEAKGFLVQIPEMPDAEKPQIDLWVPKLIEVVGTPDEQTYLIGHSMGCQTILRYLQTIDQKIGGIALVAGFFTLNLGDTEGPESTAIAEPWLTTPIDTEKVKKNFNAGVAIFSNNDPYVTLDNEKAFKDRLGVHTIILNNKGHFSGSEGITELPVVLEELLKISN